MLEFQADAYAPPDAPTTVALHAADVAMTTDQVTDQTAPLRFLGAVLVAEDETCFYLHQSSSADAVREAMTRRRPATRTDHPSRPDWVGRRGAGRRRFPGAEGDVMFGFGTASPSAGVAAAGVERVITMAASGASPWAGQRVSRARARRLGSATRVHVHQHQHGGDRVSLSVRPSGWAATAPNTGARQFTREI